MKYKLNDRVTKTTGDYLFTGVVVAAFTKLDGTTERYVVENADKLLHIFSPTQLSLVPPMPVTSVVPVTNPEPELTTEELQKLRQQLLAVQPSPQEAQDIPITQKPLPRKKQKQIQAVVNKINRLTKQDKKRVLA
jgi:hypothetical protein